MPQCVPVRDEATGLWRCEVCGLGNEPEPYRRNCVGRRLSDGTREVHKHEMPSLAKMGWNIATSLASFVADGCKTVDADEYKRRLEICDKCEHRIADSNRCTKCGCYLSIKAKGRAFECPENKWPDTQK
jgi:hypothetical protein